MPITIKQVVFYPTNEAAAYLGKSMALVRKLVKDGELEAIAVGHTYLIEQAALDTYKVQRRRKVGRPKKASDHAANSD